MRRGAPTHGATRRGLLAAAVGGLATLAGCSTRSDGDGGGVSVPALEVENQDDDAHDVRVVLSREDESRAFAETAALAAGDATVFDAPVDGPAAYSVVATLDDDRIERELASYAGDGEGCVRPLVRVTADAALKVTAQTYDDC